MAEPASRPLDAATVILIRDGGEVFMIRRHRSSGFFGGAYAFPGGKLDQGDLSAKLLACLGPEAPAKCAMRLDRTPGSELTREKAAGLYVAACRELFEEAGVLLGRHPDGSAWQPPGRRALEDLMKQVHGGELSFGDLLADQELILDLEGLAYWAHWITPSFEPKRYDTRFFVAAMPADQTALIDAHEATDYLWATPADALGSYVAGDIVLPPPTFRNLEELASVTEGAADPSDLLAACEQRPVCAILPKIANLDGHFALILPWDPIYAATDGDPLPTMPDFPAAWLTGPSRIVFDDNQRWASVRGVGPPS